MTATEEIIVRKCIQNATIRNCIEIVRWVDFPLSDIGAWVVALVIIHVGNIARWRASITSMHLYSKSYRYTSKPHSILLSSLCCAGFFTIDANVLHFWWFACKIMTFPQNSHETATKTSTSVNLNNKNFKFLHVNRLFKWLRFFSKMNKMVKLSK